ncbi:septum site-determining protein Ssd [Cellulomonas sp. HZM]|uniref:septum site-determining protein Ssd n=1 Tax=Cellulomonas sp. HZM TaxID=1454010 RepID=UPI000AD77DBC|nr:septum site-determining protein Ssd [Cellulomonas sp. HZM]
MEPRRDQHRAHVVGVLGARGGAGATTLAAALASRLSGSTATALVDLDAASGGLDVLLGLEQVDGARWPDLAEARGDVDGAGVVALLPRWGRCAVLSADRLRPGAVAADVARDVLRALAATLGVVVVDLDRAGAVARAPAVEECDEVLLVVPRDVRSVAGATALLPSLERARVGLVTRGPAPGGLGTADVAAALGVEPVAVLPVDRGLDAGVERGGLRTSAATSRAVARIARDLGSGRAW